MKLTSKQKAAVLLVAKFDVFKEYGVSRDIMKGLVEEGFLVETKAEKVGRGKKPTKYVLTSKGNGFLNLAKGWNKKAIA